MKTNKELSIIIITLFLSFIFSIIFINNIFSNIKIDLTENKIFTLSQGTKNILENLENKVKIKFFFSENKATSFPEIHNYGHRVKGILKQYSKFSKGKIEVEFIVPQPFSEEEDKALELGIRPLTISQNPNNNIYFGASILGNGDELITIPFFDPSKENFLEYELTKNIYELNNTKQLKVGILSWINDNSSNQDPEEPFVFEQLKQQYQIVRLDNKTNKIPDNIDILMVIHPNNIEQNTEYAIDQFVLKGGKTIIFVDPNREKAKIENKSSDLPNLFKAWGINYSNNLIVADRKNSLKIKISNNPIKIIDNVIWLELKKKNINRKEIITSNLNRVNFITSGSLSINDDNHLKFQPLLTTSNDTMEINVEKVRFTVNPENLLSDFKPTHHSFIIAGILTGKANSAFQNINKNHINQSSSDINVAIFADSDFIDDVFWVQKQNFLGEIVNIQLADNGPLILNTVDFFSGDSNLISLRSRNTIERPFELIEEIKKRGEIKFLKEERRLKKKINSIQSQLNELHNSSNQSNQLFDNKEENLLKDLQNDLLETRKELRKVQHNLNKEIETVQSIIKLINIALLPFIIILLSFIIPNMLRRSNYEVTDNN